MKKQKNTIQQKEKNPWLHRRAHRMIVALFFIIIAMLFSLLAVVFEESSIAGDAVLEKEKMQLREFKTFNDLETLAPGNYFISDEGIVYWMDSDDTPAIGKLLSVMEGQKSASIYIDKNGNIGYLLRQK